MFIRTVKVPSSNGTVNVYVRIVEAYRQDGKVKQRVIADLGRKDLLTFLLPQLQRVLLGQPSLPGEDPDAIDVLDASTWGPILVVRALFKQLGLWELFDQVLGASKTDVSFTDRAFVLIANRLIHPCSEHGLARWLETDFVCDRLGRRFVPHWHQRGRVQVHHRQLDAWYRTLDRLLAGKNRIEVYLYERLRDLFSLQPDLVFFDITSTYFEGAGPKDFAKHGYSRDGKSRNVQVVVGLVMVAGWPIAHHVWEGNRLDSTTVQEVVSDLKKRFAFARVVFVGDRGMVSEDNLEALERDGHGYLVGVKRRRNAQLDGWLQSINESAWIDCPLGITAREKKEKPLRTRVQEVASGDPKQRVFVIDSDERRQFEQAKREQSMERARQKLLGVQQRVAKGRLKDPAKIGAAAQRALQAHKGQRYFAWEVRDGAFKFFEHPVNFEREKRLEGCYVIATSEKNIDALTAVAKYKELTEVETGFRRMKDVLSLRPVYHQSEPRVRGHIFVAALGLLLQTLLQSRLEEAGVNLSAEQAIQALETIRHVTFNVNGQQRSGVSAKNPRAQQVLKALDIDNLRPPTPPGEDLTVM
jgi:transposase